MTGQHVQRHARVGQFWITCPPGRHAATFLYLEEVFSNSGFKEMHVPVQQFLLEFCTSPVMLSVSLFY